MKTYRAKPLRKKPGFARLQTRHWLIFWITLATGSTPVMQRYAREMEQRHAWKKHIAAKTVIPIHPNNR